MPPMRAPKKPVPTHYFPHIYALLSRKNCIDLCQIPHDRDQHRSVTQTLLSPPRPNEAATKL